MIDPRCTLSSRTGPLELVEPSRRNYWIGIEARRHCGMSPSELSNLQFRLARWQRQRGTVRVVVVITVFSVLVSTIICYGAFVVAYGSIEGIVATIDTFGLVLPVVVPLIVAPIASLQLTSVLATASALIDELEAAHIALRTEVEQRQAAQVELERLARSDALTGLLNRRGFFDALATLEPHQLERMIFTTVDVDQFKSVNDDFGHAAGDLVLREVAGALAQAAGREAIVARMGGDEFVAALVDGASTVETIRAILDDLTVPADPNDPLQVRCSVGSAAHVPGASIDLTLAAADLALYRDKASIRRRGQIRSSAS